MAGAQKRRQKTKQGRSKTDLELEKALLDDIVKLVGFVPELRECSARTDMNLSRVFREMRNLFDREHPKSTSPAGTGVPDAAPFDVDKSGRVSYEDAKALYRKLSRYFAQLGMNKTSKAERQRRGRLGAEKRWSKTTKEG